MDQERELIQFIEKNPKMPYNEVRFKFKRDEPPNNSEPSAVFRGSRRTVNRYANRNGIKAIRPVRKPRLKPHHRKGRRQFVRTCLKFADRTKKMVFSDEKLFRSIPKMNNVLVRCRPKDRFDHSNVIYSNTGGPTVNVWYAIGPFGKGPMLIAEHFDLYDHTGRKLSNQKYRGFDNESYCKMLDNHALPRLIKQMNGPFYFQQDNAPHHSKRTPDKSLLTIQPILDKHKAATIKWPSLSPDLNVIENVHTLVQAQLDLLLQKYRPKNKRGLFSLVKRAYSRVDNKSIQNIFFSFLKRCEKVQELRGGNNYRA